MRQLNQWEQTLKDCINKDDKFYLLKSFYEHLKRISKLQGKEYAFHVFELMCEYAFYGTMPDENNEDILFFNNILQDYIAIGMEIINDRKRSEMLLSSNNGYVYIIHLNGYYKIGRTIDPEKRFGEYTKLMEKPQTICCIYTENYKQVENELHKMFKKKRTNGEWFVLSDDEVTQAIQYIEGREISPELEPQSA